MNPVRIAAYPEREVDLRETLRYAGMRGDDPLVSSLAAECIAQARGKCAGKVVWTVCGVSAADGTVDLGFSSVRSRDLCKNLDGCDKCVIFAATVGYGIDRLGAAYRTLSPAKSLLFHALGAERIESVCDAFDEDIKKEWALEGYKARPRFSPGYGDLKLSFQTEVFRLLEPQKNIGVTIGEDLLMTPTKSVTALIGLSKT